MDPREMETLVQRLVQNPHDQDAIAYAHHAGQQDPRSYAMLLEKVGTATADPAFASHWLTEAANVWATSLGDAHRAARALMIAIDRDPTQPTPAERLGELYREKGDSKALVALLERRAKALAPLLQQDPSMRGQVAAIHEELGRLWSEAPLSQPKKAIENFRRAVECDPTSQYAIYALREMYKAQGLWAQAVPLFELELRLVDDNERRIALLGDEAEVRRSALDLEGATQAYRSALEAEGGQDATLKQQVAALVLERAQARQPVGPREIEEAAQLFVDLSEEYPGEHGFSYALCALELSHAHDRAMQLAIYYGEQLGRVSEAATRAAGYLRANPQGPLAQEARAVVTQAMELGGDDSLLDALAPAPGAGIDEQVASLVEVAQALARKAKKHEAAAKYKEALAIDPDNLDALGFLEPFYRQTRKFVELRDMLLTAARHEDTDLDQRKTWLKEVATLCETQLRDPASAITALREIVELDADDDTARGQLKRLLEKSGQWDALAEVLTQEAEQTLDVEARISLEKSLAKLHELRRKDPIATGETWARIASFAPDDEEAILSAVSHFERGERPDLAARVISDNLEAISSEATRAPLLRKLGDLRIGLGDPLGAGEAFAEAGALAKDDRLWRAAEEAFSSAEAWDQAATAIDERAQLAQSDIDKAGFYATEAEYLSRAGDEASAVLRLEQATDLDPQNDDYADRLEAQFEQGERREDLANFLIKRADKLNDRALRVGLRKRAATLQRDALSDFEGARATLSAVLEDGDDADALLWLAEDAQQGGEPALAVDYWARLIKVTPDRATKVDYALREAALVADGLDDPEGAVRRYRAILDNFDPKHVGALERIADLSDHLDRPRDAAEALERRLELVEDTEAKVVTAERLAALYEGPLDDPKAAIRVLDIIRSLEPENFDAVQRLAELCERTEDWQRVADLSVLLIEVEGDEEEVSRMTRRMAEILHKKVGKGDEALAALMHIGDAGDEPGREEYVRLGDELGWKGVVATKLVEWYVDAANGPVRNDALRGAFDRFLSVGREADAASVAKELARTRGADAELAERLEVIAVNLKDLDALSIAHDLIAQDLSGQDRAEELVRQAEVLVDAGVEATQAVQHGEQSLTSVPPAEVGPLLERLAVLAKEPGAVIDIYERQVTRCKVPSDRLLALSKAAQVAAANGAFDRARQFLDVALGGNVQEETLVTLEEAARSSDAEQGGDRLRRTLADALAAGGQGSRDGGRTRSALLGRAAELAYRDLKDTAQAFSFLGDAIVAHVDEERLDALEALAEKVGEPKRAETVLSRALEEVFDGPLVRKLLARRATLRREKLDDSPGAANDLKRLHDLSPSDVEVMEQLSALYTELKDYRGMVQLYEDQILRGKDPGTRAELARKVARLWEAELDDAREAADAWRRVLRMKAGDPEATEGLERAKGNMLKRKADPDLEPSRPTGEAPQPPQPVPAKPSALAQPIQVQPVLVQAPAPSLAQQDDDEEEEELSETGGRTSDFGPEAATDQSFPPGGQALTAIEPPAREAAARKSENGAESIMVVAPPLGDSGWSDSPARPSDVDGADAASAGPPALDDLATRRGPPNKPKKGPAPAPPPPRVPSAASRPSGPGAPPPAPSSIRPPPPPPGSRSRGPTPPPPPVGARPPAPPPGARSGRPGGSEEDELSVDDEELIDDSLS